MVIRYKGGKTDSCLAIDTDKKTYSQWHGTGSGLIELGTKKEIDKLVIKCIENGYTEVK